MWSFLTGLASAAVLAGATLWVLEAGTITMVERDRELEGRSLRLEDIWEPMSAATMSVPLATKGDLGE